MHILIAGPPRGGWLELGTPGTWYRLWLLGWDPGPPLFLPQDTGKWPGALWGRVSAGQIQPFPLLFFFMAAH